MGALQSIYDYCNDIMGIRGKDSKVTAIYVPISWCGKVEEELAETHWEPHTIFGIPFQYWNYGLEIALGDVKKLRSTQPPNLLNESDRTPANNKYI